MKVKKNLIKNAKDWGFLKLNFLTFNPWDPSIKDTHRVLRLKASYHSRLKKEDQDMVHCFCSSSSSALIRSMSASLTGRRLDAWARSDLMYSDSAGSTTGAKLPSASYLMTPLSNICCTEFLMDSASTSCELSWLSCVCIWFICWSCCCIYCFCVDS